MRSRRRALGPWPVRVLIGLSVPFGILMLLVAATLTFRVWSQTFGPSSAYGATTLAAPASASAAGGIDHKQTTTGQKSAQNDSTGSSVLGGASGAPPSSPGCGLNCCLANGISCANGGQGYTIPLPSTAPAEGKDTEKDALPNAMSAIGTAVAVLALILTLGTTWFANLLGKVQDEFQTIDDRQRQQEHALQQAAALLRAKRELASWIGRQDISDGADLVAQWSLALETLSADDLQLRFESYIELVPALRPHANKLPEIARYCSMCHELAVSRLERDSAGVRRSTGELRSLVDEGLWCRLFDPAEHGSLKRAMEARRS